MLFRIKTFKKRQGQSWKPATCFIGSFSGMFYHEQTKASYIVGQVKSENRIYQDQVYEVQANGISKVEFDFVVCISFKSMLFVIQLILFDVNTGTNPKNTVPQTVRRFLGCTEDYDMIKRKKRFLGEKFGVEDQADEPLFKRVAKNLFYQFIYYFIKLGIQLNVYIFE